MRGLVGTEQQNFAQVVGNGQILIVPCYQRDYSWEEEQWNDMWNYLIVPEAELANGSYMGYLVLQGHEFNQKESQVIDG